MRILQVMKSMDVGGAETVVRTLCEQQTQAGHTLAVASMPGPLLPSFSVPWHELPESGAHPRLMLSSGLALRRIIQEFRPDVVHAHNPGIIATTGVATLRGRTVPAIATLHGSALDQYRNNALLVRAAGLPVYACGPAVADLMAQAGRPVDGTVINGVLTTVTRDRATMRRELDLPDDAFVVAQVGRLVEQKVPSRAVEAMVHAPDATLLLVGEGAQRPELERLARELGVADRIRFLGRRSDVHDVMVAADAVMLSGDFEGLPLTLLEAMTVGRPVIGTRVRGIAELVRPGVDGLVAEPDPQSLGAAIRQMGSDAAARETMGAAGRARSSEFTGERMAQNYLDLYEAVTG